MPRTAALKVTASACLTAFVVLAVAVAHSRAPDAFESPVINWLGPPSAVQGWIRLGEILAVPTLGAVFVITVLVGCLKRVLGRVVVYAALAGLAVVVSEDLAKPLIGRTYVGEPTFPSGNVTAVAAAALAVCLALWPRLGKRARLVVAAVGVAWVLSMSLAMVGALWHAPLDDVGSIVLAVGVVTAGGAAFESVAQRSSTGSRRLRDRSRAVRS